MKRPQQALALATVSAAAVLWWAERRRALRPRVEPVGRHQVRNAAVAALGAVALQLAERPLVEPLAREVVRRRWGLLQRARPRPVLGDILALLLLDYTLYIWHVLVHRVPALWRFHQVHHVDLDLDTSTAVRFHFGELLLSVPWRAAQVAVLGISPRSLALWQHLLIVSIVFHHSNLRLPHRLERALGLLLVTPRLHGIHHSDRPEETNSNWSSGLTIWDRLHGTFRDDVPQERIRVGVSGFEDEGQVTLIQVLALPFTPQLPDPAGQ